MNLGLTNEQLILAFKTMIKSREADEWAISLNRQGRMPTYPPCIGQEANSIGSVLALEKDDWIVPAFREMGGMLLRGIPLEMLYLYYYGNEKGSMFDSDEFHCLPVSVPIASQTLHAVGLAAAERYKKTNRVALTFVGDGGTSEGEFYEAINIAGAWKAPVIFFIQNNQWAISTPRKVQTAAETLSQKAVAAGIPGIQVDGNDVFAVYNATKEAIIRAREGKGPTLIEGLTYRISAHTTADDPRLYRDESEVEVWKANDPILRFKKVLLEEKIITELQISTWQEEAKKEVMKAFEQVEAYPKPDLHDMYRYQYQDVPVLLKEQYEHRKQLLKELL